MKPPLPPEIQGRTPAERMDNALRTVLKVPKEVVLREEEKEKEKEKQKRERKKKPHSKH